MMQKCRSGTLFIFLVILGFARPDHEKTLNAGTLSFLQNLIAPPSQQQIESLMAFFYNISQSLNGPQINGGNTSSSSPQVDRILRPVFQNPIFTTLPFNNLSSAEISWFGETNNAQEGKNNDEKRPRLFGNGGQNTTYADLNFLTLPQLFGMLGRR